MTKSSLSGCFPFASKGHSANLNQPVDHWWQLIDNNYFPTALVFTQNGPELFDKMLYQSLFIRMVKYQSSKVLKMVLRNCLAILSTCVQQGGLLQPIMAPAPILQKIVQYIFANIVQMHRLIPQKTQIQDKCVLKELEVKFI